MHVELMTTVEQLADLEVAWNDLAAEVPFRSWDWLATWWRRYGTASTSEKNAGPRRLNVLAVHKDGCLVGVAPWYCERSLVAGNVLRWLGDGEVCTDHSSLICHPDHMSSVTAAIADALTGPCDDWDRIDLEAVDADDTAVAGLLAHLGQHGCGVARELAVACWAVELPATWDEYLAAISKSHRKQLRQLERRVLDSPRIRWHRVESPEQFTVAWPILVDLHQRRRKSLGEPGCFSSQKFLDFHYEAAGRLLGRGLLRMSWLELDGAPIAAEYHLAGGSTTYAYQGGVEPDRLAEEPGRLSSILCLRAAIEEGHRHFDFLRGDEPYKAHWRAVERATLNCRVTPGRRTARLRGEVVNAADRVTDWVRQGARRIVGSL
jgi:CelD/BcsL family acetyltransferase involved in cellulose biosynthesis